MKTRDGVIEYQKTLDDAGTLIKDISIRDPVSALYLEFQATNEATSNEDNFISDIITKVEIVDGSEVLYSLNQAQLEALYFYKTGKVPVMFPSEWGGGSQRHGVYLLFGRYLYDQMYAMDFTKYDNPQLKITTNIAAVRAIGSALSFATGTIKGTIVAKIMEDVAAPSKYLMAKQIENFTSTTGEKRVNMPRDKTYRMLLARYYLEGYDPREIITDLKLTCDTDAFVPFNRKLQQLDAEALAAFGEGVITHTIYRATGGVIRGLFQVETQFEFKPNISAQFTVFVHTLNFSGNVTLETQTPAGGSAGTRLYWGTEKGHALHAVTPIIFGLRDEPATWFNPAPYGKIELVHTQGTADAKCEIALEQERTIP